ncbi:MAG: hypothetical protein FJZ56_06580, partial [Chlamydiae bacterium]|nr:hypothetical protein [Chlamydiota bacterium]
MRCIAVFQDPSEASSFSERLKRQKIKSEIETGDDKKYIVWVIEEDDVQKALSELKIFQENPVLSIPEERDPPEGIEEANSADKVELDELRPGRAMREEFKRLKMYNITVQMKSMVTKAL